VPTCRDCPEVHLSRNPPVAPGVLHEYPQVTQIEAHRRPYRADCTTDDNCAQPRALQPGQIKARTVSSLNGEGIDQNKHELVSETPRFRPLRVWRGRPSGSRQCQHHASPVRLRCGSSRWTCHRRCGLSRERTGFGPPLRSLCAVPGTARPGPFARAVCVELAIDVAPVRLRATVESGLATWAAVDLCHEAWASASATG